MKTLSELHDERTHYIKSAQDIIEKAESEDRALTEDEKKEFDDLQADADKVERQMEAVEETERRKAASAKALETLKPKNRPTVRMPVSGGVEDEDASDRPKIPATAIYSKLRAFANTEEGRRDAFNCGQWVRAYLFGDERAARYCQNMGLQVRAQSETTNTAGGYLVPSQLNQSIIDLREEYGVFRRECEVMPMGRDVMEIPRAVGGLTATFTAENNDLTESDQVWDSVTLTAKKLGVMTRMSTEVAEDAVINLADWLATKMAEAFALKEDQCGFTGTGTATFGSIVGVNTKFNNDNTLAGAVDATSVTTFAAITAAQLATLMGTLPAYARRNAKWYISQTGADVTFGRLAAAAGGNTMTDLAGALKPTYLGHEIVVSQVMPTTGTNNQVLLLFGDLRLAAALGDRRGITVRTTEDRYFVEDQIAIKATERFDINVHDVGDGTTAGPIVALIANT